MKRFIWDRAKLDPGIDLLSQSYLMAQTSNKLYFFIYLKGNNSARQLNKRFLVELWNESEYEVGFWVLHLKQFSQHLIIQTSHFNILSTRSILWVTIKSY